ncbi:unnamed protein product [Cuscuta europaea]|uniref:Uncharacterized protein n=1 Tax=Cuscuta europaea TaxID=41803 RepID=A0A9P0ZTH7_CUSEU|nr:unnamed protein product [Cuscuta europaea]
MNVKGLARLKNKSVKDPKEADAGSQKPVCAFFKKGGDVAATKRKASGKGKAPEGKKPKQGDAKEEDPPVVIVDEHPMETVAPSPPQAQEDGGGLPREDISFSLLKGTAIVHGNVDLREFLQGVTPPLDKGALGRLDDAALESKILQSSLTACIALGEHARRFDEWRLQRAQEEEKVKKLVHDNSEAVRLMSKLEEDLRQMKLKLEAAEKSKADAERAAAEEAKKAAEGAEEAKKRAVELAREAFVTEGWKAEECKEWMSSVVAASVDEWCEGPGEEWLARKGKEYYDGGEFFTQALIYRRMAPHLNIEPKDFDPSAYGLPLLQPDVREPLPLGVKRPDLEDTELMKEVDDEEVVGDEVTSRPAEKGVPLADNV